MRSMLVVAGTNKGFKLVSNVNIYASSSYLTFVFAFVAWACPCPCPCPWLFPLEAPLGFETRILFALRSGHSLPNMRRCLSHRGHRMGTIAEERMYAVVAVESVPLLAFGSRERRQAMQQDSFEDEWCE